MGELTWEHDNGPSPERRARGPVAIFECFQPIPCDPCHTACPVGAVKEFDSINDLPVVDYNKCTGCGLCVAACPGLAIVIVDERYSDTESLIKLPYEFLPVPRKGDVVTTLDRNGRLVGKGRVAHVTKAKDFTHVVTLAVPRGDTEQVRNFHVGG